MLFMNDDSWLLFIYSLFLSRYLQSYTRSKLRQRSAPAKPCVAGVGDRHGSMQVFTIESTGYIINTIMMIGSKHGVMLEGKVTLKVPHDL